MQDDVYIYPEVNENDIYAVGSKAMRGKEIADNGIRLSLAGNYRATFLEMERK